MPFKKGRKKTGGRQKGTPNKHTYEFKRRVQAFVLDNFDEFVNLLNSPEVEDAKKIEAYLKVLQYVLPKQSSIELETGEETIKALKPLIFKSTGIQPQTEEKEA